MKLMKRIFVGICALMISAMPVLAADNGCAKEENDRINPALALCSTHVYNIRQTQNQTGVNKQAMRDVVALKTTVMTQQMNKQYEYLEAMIRRFKTQLEKAVLTTGLEAKGASSSSSADSGNSFRSDDRNVHMAGVKNCNNELLPTDVMTCLNNNMNTMSNATDNANEISSAVRKQLVNDFKLLNGTDVSANAKCEINLSDGRSCLEEKNVRKKADFRDCFDYMRNCLRSKSYALSQAANQQKK